MRLSRAIFSALGIGCVLLPGYAQQPLESTNRQISALSDFREALDDPPIFVKRSDQPVSPAVVWTRSTHESIQVNVDEFGNNIVGDAANEPSIAVDPTDPNRMAIGWRQFDTVESNFRQAGWGYTVDGGQSWTFPGVIDPGVFRSDPVLDFDLDGNFYYSALTIDPYSVDMHKSTDGGVTWGSFAYAFGGDKQWITIDRTGGMGSGNIYQAWSPWGSCCGANLFTRSTDGGSTYENPVPVAGDPFFGTLTVGPDGTLYITGSSGYPYGIGSTLLVVRSTNAQNPLATPTFTVAAEVDLGGPLGLGTTPGPNPAGLLGQPWIAADHSGGPTHGNLYLLASVDPSGSDPLDVMFSRSTDGGFTWSSAVRINGDPVGTNAWQWFGTMSVAPDGRIDVVWNDTRNSGTDNLCELYYSFSTDAGVTWSENEVISPMFDSHVGWPQQNKLGDYYDMISDNTGANLAWAATFNGEQDVYFTRILPFDCNGNGVDDSEDIALENSADVNENGVPDECEGPLVLAEGCRYVAATPGLGSDRLALRVTSPDYPCLDKYVAANGRLTDSPVYRTGDEWGTAHVHGRDIVPATTYDVLMEFEAGGSTGPFTATTPGWGDAVGDFIDGRWTPPNGVVDFNDIGAAADAFKHLPIAPPWRRCDVASSVSGAEEIPEGVIDFSDIGYIVDAFRGNDYPFDGPGECP